MMDAIRPVPETRDRPGGTARPVVKIHDSDTLLAWRKQGDDRRLVVSFSGWGNDTSVPQGPAFVKTCSMGGENTLLFFADVARSYYTRPGMTEIIKDIIAAEAARIPSAEVVFIGDSMGAYGALLMASLMPATRVIAFAPSIDVSPRNYGLKRFARSSARYHDPEGPPPLNRREFGESECFILWGLNYTDAPHLPLLTESDKLHIAVLPLAPHTVPHWLKAKGRLYAYSDAGIRGDLAAWRREVRREFGAFRPELLFWLYWLYSEWRWGLKVRFNRNFDRIFRMRKS